MIGVEPLEEVRLEVTLRRRIRSEERDASPGVSQTAPFEVRLSLYTCLLGVESETAIMPDGNEYTAYMRDGVPLAGTMAMPDEVRAMKIPSHWSVYFQVDEVDSCVEKVTSLGGAVHLPPTDIADVGRIAFVGDHQDVGFGLITPSGEWSTTS